MLNTILVVDDDRNIRYSLKRMFEDKGINVLEAKNGNDALGLIKKQQIDLVLMWANRSSSVQSTAQK